MLQGSLSLRQDMCLPSVQGTYPVVVEHCVFEVCHSLSSQGSQQVSHQLALSGGLETRVSVHIPLNSGFCAYIVLFGSDLDSEMQQSDSEEEVLG